MPKVSAIKKIVLSCLVFILLTFSFVPNVKAQGSWYNQEIGEWYTKVYDQDNQSEIFGERYTAAQLEWIIWSALTWLPTKIIGPKALTCVYSGDVGTCLNALFAYGGIDTPAPQANREDHNLFKTIFSEERPISAITYFKDIARKFHLIEEVKAQNAGFGFDALSPILGMWRASRNIAYALFVIAILVLAFMVMFRVKISPQVVITAQSALPKVVFAIILATFSYAIAGFLIDLMYVVIGIVSLLGSQFFAPVLGYTPSSTTIFNFLTLGQPFDIQYQGGVLTLFLLYITLFILSFFAVVINTFGLVITGLFVAIGLSATVASSGIGALIGTALGTILLFVILWMFVKILWTLIKAFVSILLLTIFAPLQIALGTVVPDVGFSSWLRGLLSNLSVFIVTGALFLLSYAFLFQAISIAYGEGWGKEVLDTIIGSGASQSLINLTGGGYAGWPPLLGFGESALPLLLLGVSFVLFTIIPQSADIIKSMIEKKPFAYGFGAAAKTGFELTGIPAYRKYVLETTAGKKLADWKEALKKIGLPDKILDRLVP